MSDMKSMKFVWEVNKKDWVEYPALVRNSAEGDGMVNTAGVVGCCRIGDLVFDIRAWGEYNGKMALGYELYVGGVDDGYNETADGYPYDYVGYDEFPISVLAMKLSDFEKMAEPMFELFIQDANKEYKKADLIAKAKEPTNYML